MSARSHNLSVVGLQQLSQKLFMLMEVRVILKHNVAQQGIEYVCLNQNTLSGIWEGDCILIVCSLVHLLISCFITSFSGLTITVCCV